MVNILFKSKNYKIQSTGKSIDEAFKKLVNPINVFKIYRSIGYKWSKKLVLPTYLVHGKNNYTNVDIFIPDSFRRYIEDREISKFSSEFSIPLDESEFPAQITGFHEEDDFNLNFSAKVRRPDEIGKHLKNAYLITKSYNITVEKIEVNLNKSDNIKNLNINLEATIPENICRSN